MPHARPDIVALARAWIGTPYHHQASSRGAGADCIGLVRGIYRELYGREAQQVPAYTRDWAESSGRETLIEAARRHLVEIPLRDLSPGSVLVFRYRGAAVAKHTAILATPDTMIHAMEGAPVCEVALSPWWRRRLAAAFSFPATSPRKQGEHRSEGRVQAAEQVSALCPVFVPALERAKAGGC
jgi:NlpC/P60 family putative phage cell wall peptidase